MVDYRDPEDTPTTAGGFASACVAATLAQVPVWLPAEVVAWYGPGQGAPGIAACVDVRVLLQTVRQVATEDDLQPGEVLLPIPGVLQAAGSYGSDVVARVPVAYPGPRRLRIRGPLEVGEQGALLISTRGVERWRQGDAATAGGPVDPILGLGFRPSASCFVPGLEVAATEGAGFPLTSHTLGDPEALSTLELAADGSWTLSSPTTITTSAPVTQIDGPAITLGTGPALGLAKNAQQLAIWSAFVGAVNALPPGPITDVELKAIVAGLAGVIAAASGTTQVTGV